MKKVKMFFCIVILGIMYLIGFLTLFNNNSFSDIERRDLATFPKITFNNLFKKSYYDDLTSAYSDQLAFRNYLVKGYYLFQFQNYFGDVSIGKENQLYSAYQTINDTYYDDLRFAVYSVNEVANDVSKAGAEFFLLSIPRKDAVMTEYLPSSYISSKDIYLNSMNVVSSNVSEAVKIIDGYDIFCKNKDIKPYFSTDHHLNPYGGDLLYREIVNNVGLQYYDLFSNYDIDKVIVNGAFNRQISQKIIPEPEELLLIPKYHIDYTRYDDGKVSYIPVFGEGNSYEDAYMGGDKGFTIVDTHRDYLPNVLYVGSSFTNILESLSIPSFNKMISVDYRHNNSGKQIVDYVKEYDIDYVVYVPSQSTNAFPIAKMYEHLGKG